MKYEFVKANKQDVNQFFELIKKRVEWMNLKGIHQWNDTNYLKAYPIQYYDQRVLLQQLYVLKDNQRVVGGIVIYEEDDQWDDYQPAYYLHHFVSDVDEKSVGTFILKEVSTLAKSHHKTRLRLDCDQDNQKLNDYYESQGFIYAGKCQDGPYIGNKREKIL